VSFVFQKPTPFYPQIMDHIKEQLSQVAAKKVGKLEFHPSEWMKLYGRETYSKILQNKELETVIVMMFHTC
jgi:hypothetical protein